MSETLALLISGISVIGSIGVVFSIKGKYAKLTKELENKEKQVIETQSLSVENKKANESKVLTLELEIKNLKNKNDELSIKIEEGIKKNNDSSLLIDSLKKEINLLQSNPVKKNNVQKSILMVDDSVVIRTKMKKLLVDAGYEVILANDGAEALNILPTKNFDLIITDLEMPNVDGFELIAKTNENPKTKDIPVIVITGHDEVHIKTSQSENLAGINKKPWKEPEFLQKVNFLCSLTK